MLNDLRSKLEKYERKAAQYGQACSASIWMGTATIRMAISAVALRG